MLCDQIESKPDIRRAGPEVIEKIFMNVTSQLKLHPIRVFILAFIAGGIICYGAAIGIRLSVVHSPFIPRIFYIILRALAVQELKTS